MAAAEGRDRGQVREPGAVAMAGLTASALRPTIPGLLVIDLAVHGGQPRLVQGELAARARWSSSGCPTSGRCRTTCRSTPRPGRPGASTPSRGTSWSRWPRAGSSAPGSTCGPASTSAASSPSSSGRRPRCSSPAAWATPSRPSSDETAYSYLVNEHWSPAARDSYTFLNLADETLAIDWPIPLERGRALRGRPGPPAAGRRHSDGRPADADHRRQRAAGPGAVRGAARRGRGRPATELDLSRPGRRWRSSTSRRTAW